MNKNFPKRVHIIGSVGSGKTTLARKISKKYNRPFFELDNVVWMRNKSGDIRRTDVERDECLDQIIRAECWIIEGVHNHNWVIKSFNEADLIIFLDTPYVIRIYRIIMRYLRQINGIEAANYKPSFQMFKKMFKWNHYFEKHSKPQIVKMLRQENYPYIILRDNVEIEKYLEEKLG